MDYSNLFGSQFPDSTITLSNYKDVGDADETTQELIKQFQTYMDNGDITNASVILESNFETLKPYYVGMNVLNKLEEEIYNTELFALKGQNTVVSETEPTIDLLTNAIWLKPV